MSPSNTASLRIISVYLSREFLRTFCLCLLFLWTLALLIDFFDRLDDFIRQDANITAVLRYFFFKAPLFVSQMAPAAALTGSLLSLSLLSRSRELLALKACGFSTVQLARPLLLAAALLSAGVWLWNEFVVPSAFHKARVINSEEIKKKPFQGFFDERGFWYHGESAFYHIEHFDQRTGVLSGLTVYNLDGQFQVRSLVESHGLFGKKENGHATMSAKRIFLLLPLSRRHRLAAPYYARLRMTSPSSHSKQRSFLLNNSGNTSLISGEKVWIRQCIRLTFT